MGRGSIHGRPWDTTIVLSAILSLVIGSALGGTARYIVSGLIAGPFSKRFPWGTLIVNVSGSFLIGVLAVLANHQIGVFAGPNGWLFAGTGFLGCYTTVSSFSLQTMLLVHEGARLRAVANVVLSFLLCLGAVALGFAITEAAIR